MWEGVVAASAFRLNSVMILASADSSASSKALRAIFFSDGDRLRSYKFMAARASRTLTPTRSSQAILTCLNCKRQIFSVYHEEPSRRSVSNLRSRIQRGISTIGDLLGSATIGINRFDSAHPTDNVAIGSPAENTVRLAYSVILEADEE